MWEKLRSIWNVPDLRQKILFTLALLVAFRTLAHIPVPLTPVEQQALTDFFQKSGSSGIGQVLGLLDIFSGGSLQTFSIVAFSVYPYITATIVMQLLQPIIPTLQQLTTQGEAGRLKISQITRIITVPLAFLQAFGQTALYQKEHILTQFDLFHPDTALSSFAILLSLTTGTMILVWLGELITEKGVGNGISLIILVNILSNLPEYVQKGVLTAQTGNSSAIVSIGVISGIGIMTIVGIVYIYLGQRRVPVHYPTKRPLRQGMTGNFAQTTYIPLQINSAGMIPLIFASSMLLFPTVIAQYLTSSQIVWLKDTAIWVTQYLTNPNGWWYWLINFALVVAFTYFYAYVLWQQQNIAANLQKQGAFIPGYRPGEPTNRYLTSILNRITLAGALFLGIITVLPFLANVGGNQMLSAVSLLIAVGVVLDLVRQLRSQMVMRNYSGFLSG
jgi:preprotein translocase subunit SecY